MFVSVYDYRLCIFLDVPPSPHSPIELDLPRPPGRTSFTKTPHPELPTRETPTVRPGSHHVASSSRERAAGLDPARLWRLQQDRWGDTGAPAQPGPEWRKVNSTAYD